MKPILTIKFLIIFLISFQLFAQKSREQKIDSLEKQLQIEENKKEKVHTLCKLSQFYVGIDSARVFRLSDSAMTLSKRMDYKKGIANVYFTLGYTYGSYDDREQSKEYYRLAKKNYKDLIAKDSSNENLNLWVRSTYNLGVIYGREGFTNIELEHMMEVIPTVEKLRDSMVLAIINSNLGIRFSNINEFEKAYHYYKKSTTLFKKLQRPNEQVYNELSLALCLYNMDSIKPLKRILDNAKRRLDLMPNAKEWHLYYSTLGTYYSEIGKYEEAIKAFDKAYNLISQQKLFLYLENLYLQYKDTYDMMGNHKMAKKYVEKYLDLAITNKIKKNEATAYLQLASYAKEEQNYKKAYSFLNNYTILNDSLKLDDINSKIRELEVQYQTEKKEREILELKNNNNVSALALEKKKSLSYLLGLIIGTLAFILLLSYFAFRNKQRKEKILEKEHQEEVILLKSEHQAKIFSAMIEGQEKERKRLAIDLHDSLGGRLSGMSLKLSKTVKNTKEKPVQKQLNIILNDINDSLIELRTVARNLMPETLHKYGLNAALKDYCSNISNKDTEVTLQFYGNEKGIDAQKKVTIYRIIQELINNAIKHAKASEVLVQYVKEGSKIDITVEDNGIGFNQQKVNPKQGMGFSNLNTRVVYLNGNIDIQSYPKEGTTINIQITI